MRVTKKVKNEIVKNGTFWYGSISTTRSLH